LLGNLFLVGKAAESESNEMPYIAAASSWCSSILSLPIRTPSCVLFRQFIENRTQHLARAAPFRPKIPAGKVSALENFLFKVILVT